MRPFFATVLRVLVIALTGAVLTISLPVQAAPLAQSNPLTLGAEAGFDSRCKEGRWLPVRITIENNGPSFTGLILVNTGGRTQYTYEVDLPTVSRKVVTVYVFPEGYGAQVNVSLRDGNRTVATASPRVDCLARSNVLFGVVASNASAYTVLTGLKPVNGSSVMVELTLEQIPERAEGLEALDYLLFSDIDTGALSAAQVQAIENWAARGGQLVVSGGANWQKTAAGLSDLLPLVPESSQSLPGLPALEAFSSPGSAQNTSPIAGPVSVAAGRLSAGAEVLASETTPTGSLPLVVRRGLGYGSVFFLAADPAMPPLRSWDRLDTFFQTVFAYRPPPPGWANGIQNWSSARDVAGVIPNLDIPSGLLICSGLGIYILVIGPVNYLVLRKFKRRELAWISVPALVIIFSLAAFISGGILRGGTPILNRLAIVQIVPGSDQARVDGIVGVFSPNRASYDIVFAPELTAHPIVETMSPVDWDLRQSSQGVRVSGLQVEVGGVMSLSVEGTTPAPVIDAQLSLSLSGRNGLLLEGTLTNQSNLTFKDARLLGPGTTYALDDFSPGETLTIYLPLRQAQHYGMVDTNYFTWSNINQPPYSYAGIYDSTAADIAGYSFAYNDQESYIRHTLINSALSADYSYTQPNGRGAGFYLSGWVDETPLAVEIVKKRFSTVDTSLYLFRLEPELELGSNRITLPPPMFNWLMLESSTYSSFTPYGTYMNTGDRFVVLYRLAQPIPYQSVESLVLHLTTSYSSTTQVKVQVSLWNYQTETYDLLQGLSWGENHVPDPGQYVGPGGQIQAEIEALSSTYASGTINALDFILVVEQ